MSVKPISNSDISKSVRKFGSGGFGGCTGYFKNEVLGDFEMSVTDKSGGLLIETNSKKYVIS